MQHKRWIMLLMLASLFLMSGTALAQDATETPPLELSEHYVSDDERAAFSYPEGWVVEPRSLREGYALDAQLMNSPGITEQDFAIFGDGLKSGEVYMQPLIADKSALVAGMPDITTESSMEAILQEALEVNTDENIIFGEVTSLEIGDNPAARLDVRTQKGGAGFILLIELGDGMIAGLSVGAPGDELAGWESTALAIAESITVAGEPEATPQAVGVPELTQTIHSDNDAIIVSYPEGWVARSASNTEIYVAPDEESLDLSFGDKVESGQVEILINLDRAESLIDDMDLPLEAAASAEKILQGAAKAASAAGGIEFTPVTSTTIKDKPAGYTKFTSEEFEGLAWAVEYEPGYVMLIQVLAAPGEAEQWKDLAVAIAEAAKYPG